MDRDQDLVLLVGSLDGKMDMLLKGMTQHFADDKENFNKLNKKVESLRHKWAYAAGGAAVLMFIVSNIGSVPTILAMINK